MVVPGVLLPTNPVLNTFLPRGPTSPRGSNDDISTIIRQESALPRAATPSHAETTAGSNNEVISQSRDKRSKKVGWSSPSAENTSPNRRIIDQDTALQSSSTINVKPIKSILKSHKGRRSSELTNQASTKLQPPYCYPDFATMLESIIRQLAGTDLDGRFDAYYTLNNVLCAAEDAIEPAALTDKMGLLTQFIFRDLTPSTRSVHQDRLVPKALTLLGSILYKPVLARKLPVEFCAQIIDYASASLQAPVVISKEATKLILFILSVQHFPNKVMSTDRCTRLLQALQELESNVKGRSIVLLRTSIYSKLLQQCRPVMISRLEWMEHLFADMISDLQDIRTGAVKFGLEASLSLGTDPKLSRAAAELLKTEGDGGVSLVSHYFSRLREMLENDDSAVLVPRILSVVILFLRGKPSQIEQWPSLQPWLVLFSKCFNRSLYEVKLEANLAWDRFVFALDLDQTTTLSTIILVRNPILAQFQRKDNGTRAKDYRRSTYCSLCNLLYYSLRPTATHEQLDLYWDKFVQGILGELIEPMRSVKKESQSEDLKQSCYILQALLGPSKPSLWSPTRLLQDVQLGPEDLPSIDPRWVRKNIVKVMAIVVPLTRRCFQDLATKSSPISAVWISLISAITMAGSKEIKISSETMMYLSCFLDMLHQTWRDRPHFKDSSERLFYKSFTSLIRYNVDGLGVLPFTDKLYGAYEQQSLVTKPRRGYKEIRDTRPVLHILILLLTESTKALPLEEYYEMTNSILRPFFQARTTRWSTIELSTDLALVLPKPGEGICAQPIWEALADHAAEVLESKSSKSGSIKSSVEQSTDHRIKQIINILEIGIDSCHYRRTSSWTRLLHAGSKYIRSEAGDKGVSVFMIEPLARYLIASLHDNLDVILTYSFKLLTIANFAEVHQAPPDTRNRLDDTTESTDETASADPYTAFYSCITRSLKIAYDEASYSVSEEVKELLPAFELWLRQIPRTLTKGALLGVEKGLLHWFMDKDCSILADKDQPLLNMVRSNKSMTDDKAHLIQSYSVWNVVCSLIRTSIVGGNGTLKDFENFFGVGLVSKHIPNVLATIELWMGIHAQAAQALQIPEDIRRIILNLPDQPDLSVQYPEKIHAMLSSVSGDVNLDLTTGRRSTVNVGTADVNRQPESAGEAQESSHGHEKPSMGLPREVHSSTHASRSTDPFAIPQASLKGGIDEHRLKRKRSDDYLHLSNGESKIRKHNSIPKLSHDDSQIVFAPIDSSPFVDESQGSQLLTGRQREVRERQEADAVQFPELRSSPRSQDRPAAPSLVSAVTSESGLPLSNRRFVTPGIERVDLITTDDFIMSSPTPAREGPWRLPDSDAIEPPSSPPELQVRESALEAAIPAIGLLRSHEIAVLHDPSQSVSSSEVPSVSLRQTRAAQDVKEECSDMIDEDEEVAAQLLHSIELYSQEYTDELQPQLVPDVTPEAVIDDVPIAVDIVVDNVSVATPETAHSENAPESAYQDAVSTPLVPSPHSSNASKTKLSSQDGIQKHTSSWSELDESSMLRVVAPYDASVGSGQGNVKQTPSSISTDSDRQARSSGKVASASGAEPGAYSNKAQQDINSSAETNSDHVDPLPRLIVHEDNAGSSHMVLQKSKKHFTARVEEPGRRKSNRLLPPSSIPETPEPSSGQHPVKDVDGDRQDTNQKSRGAKTSTRQTRRSSRLAEAFGSIEMSSPAGNDEVSAKQAAVSETSQGNQNMPATSSSTTPKASTPSRRGKRKRDSVSTSTNRIFDIEHSATNITDVDGVHTSVDVISDADGGVSAYGNAEHDRLQDALAPSSTDNVVATSSIDIAAPQQGHDHEVVEVLRPVQAADGSVSFVSSTNDASSHGTTNVQHVTKTAAHMMADFQALLSTFRGMAMTREQAHGMDNLLWEWKKELVEAEERGKHSGH